MMKRAITFDACTTRFQATTATPFGRRAATSASQCHYTTTTVKRFSKPSRFLALFPGSLFAASAADEMDDLNSVAFAHLCLRPRGAAHDFAIEFDGDAFGRERELPYEFAERERVRQFANFPVDLNAQKSPLQGWCMTRRNSAVKPSAAARMSTAARPLVKRGSHA